MRLLRPHLFPLCALCLLAACADDPVTPVDPTPEPPVWTEITGFSPAVTLYALWAPREDYVMGVGPRGTVRRWDGLQWAATPNQGLRNLHAIAGTVGGEIVATGDDGEIVRFDGTRFVTVISNTAEDLRALWTPGNNAFTAVGSGGVILRGNGASWTADTSGVSDALFGVWGSGPDDVFAVGLNGVILHYDGASWTTMTSETTALLAAVSGTGPDDVYAVGEAGTVLHFDGVAWTPLASGTGELLQGVAAGVETVVVGANGTVLTLAGGAWNAAPGLTHEWLYAAARAGATTWVAGARAILVQDGSGWKQATRGAVPVLTGVAGPPSAPLRVVGHSGYVARQYGDAWRVEDTGDTRPFNAVWCAPDGDVFAVGSNRIVRHDGIEWTQEFFAPTELFDVNGGPSGTHAVGINGAIYRRSSNGVWSRVVPTTSVFDDLNAFVGIAVGEAYIVGNDGRIISFNGMAWTTTPTPVVSADLFDAAVTPAGASHRVIAVGEAGRIIGLRPPPGAGWDALPSPTVANLLGLARGPGGRLYAVGQSGSVIASNGAAWFLVPSPTLKPLRSAWSDGENLFVVGGEQPGGPVLLRYGEP